MSWDRVAAMAGGVALVVVVLYDLFQAVVLPRPVVGRLRVSTWLTGMLWHIWLSVGGRYRQQRRREAVLGAFAPVAVLFLLALRVGLLIVGYGLILFGLRTGIRPAPNNVGTALYLAALAMLTFGLGDIIPIDAPARAVVLIDAATGLLVVALIISLLFALFSAVQRRETAVVSLDAIAGAPPSGLQLLETCAKLNMPQLLEQTFMEWRTWAAEVLESHLAYPILFYFRSTHDNESWVGSFGAVMDAATLLVTTTADGPKGAAHIFQKVGRHLVDDAQWDAGIGAGARDAGVGLDEFTEARQRLAAVGYELLSVDEAWPAFTELRASYAPQLHFLAQRLAIPPVSWISDRSYLPHRDR